jgi:predicted GNAT family acetyltransferase
MMVSMEIQVVHRPEADRFEIHADGTPAGFVAYRRDGSVTSLMHTEIDSRFEGLGLGSALIRGALDASRAAGDSVLPVCPFVRAYIQRHPKYADLVPSGPR